MSGRFRFSLTQLFLVTTLCALAAGLVAATQERTRWVYIQTLAFSPDGGRVAVVYDTQGIQYWDVSRRASRPVCRGGGDFGLVQDLQFIGPDRVAFLRNNAEIVVLDLATNQEVRKIVLRPSANRLAVSPDAPWAVTASFAGTALDVWDLETGTRVMTLTPPKELQGRRLGQCHLSRDGRRVVAACFAATVGFDVLVWDGLLPGLYPAAESDLYATSQPRRLCVGNANSPYATDVTPDGNVLALLEPGIGVTMWDLDSGEKQSEFGVPPSASSARLSPDGQWLAIGSFDGAIEVRDTTTGSPRAKLSGQSGGGGLLDLGHWSQVVFSNDGRSVAVSGGRSVDLFDGRDFRNLGTLSTDRKAASLIVLGAGFIGWSIVWGLRSRRERRRSGQQGEVPRPRPLPTPAGARRTQSGRTVARWTVFAVATLLFFASDLGVVTWSIPAAADLMVLGVLVMLPISCAVWLGISVSSRRCKRDQVVTHRPLPAAVRGALAPGRSLLVWTLLLASIALPIACCTMGLSVATWGAIEWVTFVLRAVIGLLFLWAATLAVSYGVPAASRCIRGEHAARLDRARKAADNPGRLAHFGPVTASFFGSSSLEPFIRDEYECARARFSQLIGEPFEPDKPVLFLGFESPRACDAYFRGHLPMPAVYWATFGSREMALCERASLDILKEPSHLFRRLLANYFIHTYKRRMPPAWLGACLRALVATQDGDGELRRAHRYLRACRWSERETRLGPWGVPNDEILRASWNRQEPTSARLIAGFENQATSLAYYLAGVEAGERRHQFRGFLRELDHKQPQEAVFQRHFGLGFEEAARGWRAWRARHDGESHDAPPNILERHLRETLLPSVRRTAAPDDERRGAIAAMRDGGYTLGADALIGVLRESNPTLTSEAVWALESISGRNLGDDPGRWQDWFDGLPGATPTPIASEAVAATQSAPAEPAAGVWGAKVDRAAASASVEHERAVCPPPRALRACWALLISGGILAIVWSLASVSLFSVWSYLPWSWAVSCCGVAVGVYTLTKGVAQDTDRLTTAARMNELCLINFNIINPVLGLVIRGLLRRRAVQQYLSPVTRAAS
ncbi:MAG TPA: hypothetical protein VND64_04455 [Pirellulales bacterium]|nr:hypothetical protein [Pirellulales bacterium]